MDGRAFRLCRTIVLTSVLALLAAALSFARSAKEGAPAPPLEGTTLTGAHFSLEDYRGKVVVVTFWATWCAPCREEMPAIEAFYRKNRDKGLEVIAISMDDDDARSAVGEFMRSFTFPGAMVSNVRMKGFGRISRIPATFVVDRQGILRRDGLHGGSRIDGADLEAVVAPLLAP